MRRLWMCVGVAGVMSAAAGLGAGVGNSAGQLVRSDGGKLVYDPYDAAGDTIPDFSNAGYMGGGVAIPEVKGKVQVAAESGSGDDTKRIQKAIDEVAGTPLGKDGVRGAVELGAGEFRVRDQLKISASGVVLRGAGQTATIIEATGAEQRSVIVVEGVGPAVERSGARITDKYVAVGARKMTVESAAGLKVGDTVMVQRMGNAAWIHELKMDDMAIKKEGTKEWPAFVIDADRVITGIAGNVVTVDAPNTCAIDARWGGGQIVKYADAGRISQCGVEDLKIVSAFDASVKEKQGKTEYAADEKHAWIGVEFRNCKNCWGRHLESMYLGYALAEIGGGTKWVTVQDCRCLEPVSIITGGRRYSFDIVGQLALVQRCFADKGRHSFVVNGTHLAGPSVFLNCEAEHQYADSGPHQRWSTGTLWDSVKSTLHTQDREDMGSGHGWSGANDVYWNCSGEIVIQQPPTAENFAIGFVGEKGKAAFAKLDHPDGYYASFGKHVGPGSLYLAQLRERLGAKAVEAIGE
jgi:hypothetical protein